MVEGASIGTDSPRFVIERPRLTRLLDESRARIVVLAAPAGYGKTTLARQWLGQQHRRAVWVRADPASADVAALGTAVADAIEGVIPEAAGKMLARLSASMQPDVDGALLGRLLAETLADWPTSAWLVIDDYQFVMPRSGADALVAAVAMESSIRVVVTSRARPAWASARRVLYDEVLYLGAEQLALTRREAQEVLAALPPRTAACVMERARGWPAVIRLAALSGRPAAPQLLRDTELYDYFAEEVFNAAPRDVQDALLRLTPYPTLTHRVVTDVLGAGHGAICNEGRSRGFLSRDGIAGFELHPLLREFLEAKFSSAPDAAESIQVAFDEMVGQQRWDDAHTIITRFDRRDLYDRLIEAALPALISLNRVGTLDAWTTDAAAAGVMTAVIDLARGEVDLRLGHFQSGVTGALHAVRNLSGESKHMSRAYAVASECAHLLMRPSDATEWGRLAEKHAATDDDARRAVWAQLLAALDFELGDPLELVTRFEAIDDGSANAATRMLIAKSMTAVLVGSVATAYAEARAQLSLAERCTDVLALTSFEYRLGYVAMLAADYAEALVAARKAIADIQTAGLGFGVAPALNCLAGTMLGLRRFRRAHRLIDRLSEEIRQRPNRFSESNWHALHARLLLCTGGLEAAAKEASAAAEKAPTKSLRGEALGLRALALAAGPNPPTSGDLAQAAMTVTREVQGVTLGALAQAISAIRSRSNEADAALDRAGRILSERENYDSLVYAGRVFPPVLLEMRQRDLLQEQTLLRIITASRDTQLASELGWEIQPTQKPQPLLTPREQEVFALLCKGYSNREIGSALFITEATVKVHVRHILEKFGARSRTEAVVRFARY